MAGNFAILNPCWKKWSDLDGDGRARFCETCKTHVHSIADYSPAEWTRLWRESNGHVCGFLSGASPTPPRSRRAILFGALLSVVSPLFAATGRVRFRVIDPAGVLIPQASVSLMGSNNSAVRSLPTGESGEVVFTDLPLGDSLFVVKSPGFQAKQVPITVRNAKELKVEVHVLLPLVGEVVSIKPVKRHGWLIYY